MYVHVHAHMRVRVRVRVRLCACAPVHGVCMARVHGACARRVHAWLGIARLLEGRLLLGPLPSLLAQLAAQLVCRALGAPVRRAHLALRRLELQEHLLVRVRLRLLGLLPPPPRRALLVVLVPQRVQLGAHLPRARVRVALG